MLLDTLSHPSQVEMLGIPPSPRQLLSQTHHVGNGSAKKKIIVRTFFFSKKKKSKKISLRSRYRFCQSEEEERERERKKGEREKEEREREKEEEEGEYVGERERDGMMTRNLLGNKFPPPASFVASTAQPTNALS